MGGSESVEWIDALEASFEAGLARDEEIAATDLAFSLRQDVDLQTAVVRAGTGWTLADADGAAAAVDEVGVDYVRVGTLIVRSSRAVLRSTGARPPRPTATRFFETLGSACRAGAEVTIRTAHGSSSGRLVRVAQDHVAVRNGEVDAVVGLAAVESVRLETYSASRGLSG